MPFGMMLQDGLEKERLVSESRSLVLAGAPYRAQIEKFRSSGRRVFNVWFYGDTVLGSCMRMPVC
jgi:hypothetical protein